MWHFMEALGLVRAAVCVCRLALVVAQWCVPLAEAALAALAAVALCAWARWESCL